MSSVLELDVTLTDDTLEQQVLGIVEKIRPQWQRSQVELKPLSGGLFNKVLSVTNSSLPDDILVVKVFTPASQELVEHGPEYAWLGLLSRRTDLFELYCKFNNGYVYKHFSGRLLEREDLEKEDVVRKLFDRLHTLHDQEIPDSMPPEVLQYDANVHFLKHWIRILSTEEAKELDSNPGMQNAGLSHQKVLEMGEETMKEYMAMKERLPTVLCHGDARIHNFIIDDATGDVYPIDWDIISMGTEIPDLVAVFNRQRTYNLKDTRDAKKVDGFLRTYLERHPKYKGQEITDAIFNEWKKDYIWACYIMEKWLILDFLAFHVAFGKHIPFVNLIESALDRIDRVSDFKEIWEKLG